VGANYCALRQLTGEHISSAGEQRAPYVPTCADAQQTCQTAVVTGMNQACEQKVDSVPVHRTCTIKTAAAERWLHNGDAMHGSYV
jgi:hypothetical protein